MDEEGRCFEDDGTFEMLTGLRRTEDLGRGWLSALHPDDRDHAAAVWAHAGKTRTPYRVEYRLRLKDGSYRWYASHGRPLSAPDGTTRWVDIASDIHECKAASEVLRKSHRQYQELVNSSLDGIYQRGTDRRFLFVNPAFCRMLGYERDELLRMSVDDIRDPSDPKMESLLERVDGGGLIPALVTWRIRRRDGHWVPVESTAMRLEDGRIQVTVRDVSEREHAKAALAHQRDLYAALSETNKAIVATENRDRLFEDVCRIAVQRGKLCFASIYVLDSTRQRLYSAARFGEDNGYIDQAIISADAFEPEGRGPTGRAIRTGDRQISNDFLNDPATMRWHDNARRAGICASAAFPLRQEGMVVGTLNLYAAEPGFFTEELLPLLDDIAADLSHALDNIAREGERQKAAEALRTSEERFRTFVQATSNIVWITDAAGVTFSASRGFEDITGLGQAAALGQGWLKVLHPEDREPALAAWKYATDNRVAYTIENRIRMRDGSYRWFSVHGQPIFNTDGSVREWMGTSTDIHARKLADDALRDSQLRYRELVESSRDGIYQRDRDGRFLFVNTAFCRMMGYERDELLRMSVYDMVDTSDPQIGLHQKHLDESNEPPTLLTTRFKHRDGHWVDVESAAVRLGDGRIQVILRDISDRIETQRQLNEEQQFITYAINSLPGLFYVFDDRGEFLRWNGRLQQVTGYGTEEIAHMRPESLVTEAQRALAVERIHAAFTQGEADAEFDLETRDGRRIPYYFNGRRFRWQGRICVVGMGIDISDRRLAEQRAHEYIEQTQELSRRLLTTQELERRAIARELHDEVGSALTALQMSLKRIEDGMPVELKNPAQEVRSIVATLLSQVRTMSLDLRPSVLDDLGLSAAVRWYARERLQPAGLEVRVDIPPNLGRLPAMIESTCFRVLQGAATNALRHGHARVLEIHLLHTQDALELIVHDDGGGFDVTAARARASGGASLGILAMEERVRLVNGEFGIESAVGRGTTVHVKVPVNGHDDSSQGMMKIC